MLPLTDDYAMAKQACTTLQSSADLGATTATDSGLRLAREHLQNKVNNPMNQVDGPQGRRFATKVIVLLTDGLPNAWESDADSVEQYVATNPDSNFYPAGNTWFNSPIRHAHEFLTTQRGSVYGVGMGMGVDYDFMDRIARISRTAEGGQSPRSSGDPSAYEAQLIEIFRRIIGRPGSRLVQ